MNLALRPSLLLPRYFCAMENPNAVFNGLSFLIKREPVEQDARPGIRCEGCGGADFDSGDDGFFYCQDCGGQSQNMLETACADEDLFGEGGGLYSMRHVRHSQSQSQPQLSKEEILRSLARNLDGRGVAKEEEEKPRGFEEEAYRPMDFGRGECVDEKAVADGIRLRYVQGMQLMIQMQCKEMVEGFGVSPIICGIVGTVWLRYLAVIRVFDEGWADKAICEAEAAARERCEGREEQTMCKNGRSESHSFSRRKPIYTWASSLRKMIPIHSSLAITFLACHIAREPILPTDLVKWALEGKLPYISAFVDIDKSLGNPSATCPLSSRFLFRPIRSVGTWQLEATAGSIAQCIGLHLPSVNFYAIAQRYLKQLSLPLVKILPYACRIYEWSMPAELWLSASAFRLPTRICVLSMLIVAIRILYGLHGYGIWEKSLSHVHNSPPSNQRSLSSLDLGVSDSFHDSWKGDIQGKECHTTCSHEVKIGSTSDKEMTHTQASHFETMELLHNLEAKYNEMTNTLDYSKDLRSYLKYCNDIVFAGIMTSYEEEKLIERLWDIYEKQEEDDLVPKETGLPNGNRKRWRNEDDALMEEVTRRGDESRNSPVVEALVNKHSGTHYSEDKWCSNECADEVFKYCDPNSICMDNIPSDEHVGGSSQTDNAEDALARMKLNMEENGFEYLPPRTRPRSDDYLHYRRKKIGVKLHYVAHADYYVLLRACAKLAQVDVRIMHLGVLKLERRLRWIEQRISNSLIFFHHERERISKLNDTADL